MLLTTTAMWISLNYWSKKESLSACEKQGRRWVNFSHSLKVGVYLINRNTQIWMVVLTFCVIQSILQWLLQRSGLIGLRMRSVWLRRNQTARKCTSFLRKLQKTTSVSAFHQRCLTLYNLPLLLWHLNVLFLHLGPDIWLEYAQYSIGGMGLPEGILKVRAIFERALTAVGLHVTKGQMVWEAYREFENVILSTLQVCVLFSQIF